jgi:hypothetical protein
MITILALPVEVLPQYDRHYHELKSLEASSLKVPNLKVSTLEVLDLVLHLPQFGNIHLVHYVLLRWNSHSSSSSSG